MRVKRDMTDMVMPAEIRQPIRVSGSGDNVITLVEELSDETRADVSGSAGNKNSHGSHRTEIPAAIESKSNYRRLPRTNTPAVIAAMAASAARSASFAVRGLVLVRN